MCKWWQVEFLLKASVLPAERMSYKPWVRAYAYFMTCFPRLNVVSDDVLKVKAHFDNVPNVSFHQIVYPRYYPSDLNAKVFWRMQLPMMWADNFTTAPHILVLDIDTPLILPLRCHHLFDLNERSVWHTWKWDHPLHWATLNDNYFLRRKMNIPSGYDFMTFFPVVIPREILPIARAVMVNDSRHCRHCDFDRAFLSHPKPSYADMIGKTLAFLKPTLIHWVHCSQPSNASWSEECIDFVPAAEHTKHPTQAIHTQSNVLHFDYSKAVAYANRLFQATKGLTEHRYNLPDYVFHYVKNRTLNEKSEIIRRLISEDSPTRVCGVRATTKQPVRASF